MSWFSKKPKLPKATGKVWKMSEHQGWGNLIRWFDFDKRRITGHIGGFGKAIEIGDEIQCEMKSGKTARFIVSEVEYEHDPQDMFFGEVMDLDYAD